jgi:hypothetical protein
MIVAGCQWTEGVMGLVVLRASARRAWPLLLLVGLEFVALPAGSGLAGTKSFVESGWVTLRATDSALTMSGTVSGTFGKARFRGRSTPPGAPPQDTFTFGFKSGSITVHGHGGSNHFTRDTVYLSGGHWSVKTGTRAYRHVRGSGTYSGHTRLPPGQHKLYIKFMGSVS